MVDNIENMKLEEISEVLFQNVWMKVAGNSRHIKNGGKYHWRVYVEGQDYGIMLIDFKYSGHATHDNNFAETSTNPESKGLLAWFRVYGNLQVINHVGHIELRSPK